MENEKDILNWFNNDLTNSEVEVLRASDPDHIIEKVGYYASQLETPTVDVDKAFDEFKTKHIVKKETKVRTLNYTQLYRYAAIFVIALGLSYFIFSNNTSEFNTDIAEVETLNLPDKSEVILNASSQLSFNKGDWKSERVVNLDGEAFFMVSKGQKFTVNTEAGQIAVLGTQFNVKERDNYFEVQCYEGKVAVYHNDQTTELLPGKTFRVLNGSVQSVNEFSSTEPSWLSQETTFENIPLKEVIAELERQFNITIRSNDVDASQLFTGTFTHKDMDIALQSITIPLKLSYKINGATIIFYDYEAE